MSRPKRMLPVLGQSPKPEAPRAAPSEDAAACCTPGEADACCGSATRLGVAGLRTREADSEMLEGDLARSVVRVEGMDCASCAATVEKRAAALPGMRRAVVNFTTGRLDAEHDPGLSVQDIEKAVRDAGYGVGRTGEVESACTRRSLQVSPSRTSAGRPSATAVAISTAWRMTP